MAATRAPERSGELFDVRSGWKDERHSSTPTTREAGEMARTLEDQISLELDTLWQAALFLSGGVERGAEELLLRVIMMASHEDPELLRHGDGSDVLERLMLRQFFEQAAAEGIPDPSPGATSSDGIDAEVGELLNDAGAVPERPRAALWLVLVRRRPYDEAAEILGIDRATLRGLLTHRDLLMARAAARSGGHVPHVADGGRASREGAS